MSSYLDVVYSEKERPVTKYPAQLIEYLIARFDIKEGADLLEVGCGRGDFLTAFEKQKLNCHGVDLNPEVAQKRYGLKTKYCDIEKGQLPYDDNSFDVVYSKSLLEHLDCPRNYFAECMRVLRPGGLLLTLVPDWESNYKIYFDDYTHRRPYTRYTLDDLYKICDFTNTEVCTFRQLPIVWKYPVLNIVCNLLAPFVHVRTKIKFFKWSRELMILGSGRK